MKEQIKQLRISIDGLAQLTNNLNPIYVPGQRLTGTIQDEIVDPKPTGISFINSNELHKAYDSLILAKAWLGKLLGELGESTPYANDGNRKEVKDIEPTADVAGPVVIFEDFNHIEKVDWLREEVSKVEKIVRQLWMQPGELTDWKFSHLDLTKIMYVMLMHVEKYLSEARFWLGFELQRIKENK